MKPFTYEEWKKWNNTEKSFMLSLLDIQSKIDRIDKSMRSNIDYHDRRFRNSEDVAEFEEYMAMIEKHIPTLHKQVRILDKILEDI